MRALPLFLRKEFLHPDNFRNLEQFAYQFATVTTSASSLKNSEIPNLLVPFNFSYLTDEYSFESFQTCREALKIIQHSIHSNLNVTTVNMLHLNLGLIFRTWLLKIHRTKGNVQ